jgi:hypothetical protein
MSFSEIVLPVSCGTREFEECCCAVGGVVPVVVRGAGLRDRLAEVVAAVRAPLSFFGGGGAGGFLLKASEAPRRAAAALEDSSWGLPGAAPAAGVAVA